MRTLYQAEASATGGRNGHVRSSDGLVDFDLSIPKEMGGPGGALTNPEQLFAAGYAACFDSALGFVAAQRKIKTGPTKIDVTVGIGQNESGGFGLQVRIAASIPDLPAAEAKALLEQAHQVCPYSNAIRGNVPTELVLA